MMPALLWEVLFIAWLWLLHKSPISTPWLNTTLHVVVWSLLILQTCTVIDKYLNRRRANLMLHDVLQEADDEIEDTLREPDDNRPYRRYIGKMHPLDQAAYEKLYPKPDERGE